MVFHEDLHLVFSMHVLVSLTRSRPARQLSIHTYIARRDISRVFTKICIHSSNSFAGRRSIPTRILCAVSRGFDSSHHHPDSPLSSQVKQRALRVHEVIAPLRGMRSIPSLHEDLHAGDQSVFFSERQSATYPDSATSYARRFRQAEVCGGVK